MKETYHQLSHYLIDNPVKEPLELSRLIIETEKALDLSYAPYSRFNVAAGILLENGEILTGANQENASYPLCMCAERVALYHAAMTYPQVSIKSIAVIAATDSKVLEPVAPCGSCRQVILEYEQRQSTDIKIYLTGSGPYTHLYPSIKDLLPAQFHGGYLP